jgi:hypothetical protein
MHPAGFTAPPKWFLRAIIWFRQGAATKPDHAAVRADFFQVQQRRSPNATPLKFRQECMVAECRNAHFLQKSVDRD